MESSQIDSEVFGGVLLAGATENFQLCCYLAITVSLPETKKFMNLSSTGQKKVTAHFFKYMMSKATRGLVSKPNRLKYVFEYTKRGKVHLHALVEVSNKPASTVGFICDVAKAGHKILHQSYKDKNLYNNDFGVTYKCPSFCIELVKNQDEIDKWTKYISKTIVDEG